MRWREDPSAAERTGLDVREFENVGRVESLLHRPPGIAPEFALWWAERVRQVGTRKTGETRFVEVFYAEGSERLQGRSARAVLEIVRRFRDREDTDRLDDFLILERLSAEDEGSSPP